MHADFERRIKAWVYAGKSCGGFFVLFSFFCPPSQIEQTNTHLKTGSFHPSEPERIYVVYVIQI